MVVHGHGTPLVRLVEDLRVELALEGNVKDVVQQACVQLGVTAQSTGGDESLLALAKACHAKIYGSSPLAAPEPAVPEPAAPEPAAPEPAMPPATNAYLAIVESVHFPGSYLDAGGDRNCHTAAKDPRANHFRQWKVHALPHGRVALESMHFPGSYLDTGGDRKVWTAAKPWDTNGFRQWMVHELPGGHVALESVQFPGSFLDAGGQRKVWTAQKPWEANNFRRWIVHRV